MVLVSAGLRGFVQFDTDGDPVGLTPLGQADAAPPTAANRELGKLRPLLSLPIFDRLPSQ